MAQFKLCQVTLWPAYKFAWDTKWLLFEDYCCKMKINVIL